MNVNFLFTQSPGHMISVQRNYTDRNIQNIKKIKKSKIEPWNSKPRQLNNWPRINLLINNKILNLNQNSEETEKMVSIRIV